MSDNRTPELHRNSAESANRAPEPDPCLVSASVTAPVTNCLSQPIRALSDDMSSDVDTVDARPLDVAPICHFQPPLALPQSMADTLVFKATDLLELDELPTFCRTVCAPPVMANSSRVGDT